jgi:hypothetical protein
VAAPFEEEGKSWLRKKGRPLKDEGEKPPPLRPAVAQKFEPEREELAR